VLRLDAALPADELARTVVAEIPPRERAGTPA
jgi:hypothetical protein